MELDPFWVLFIQQQKWKWISYMLKRVETTFNKYHWKIYNIFLKSFFVLERLVEIQQLNIQLYLMALWKFVELNEWQSFNGFFLIILIYCENFIIFFFKLFLKAFWRAFSGTIFFSRIELFQQELFPFNFWNENPPSLPAKLFAPSQKK